MNEVRFSYKANLAVFSLAILFFGGCTMILGYLALRNERGLILNRIVEFSVDGATIFYWCLAIASGLFVLMGAAGIVRSLKSKREIVLTDTTISSPKHGMSKKTIVVGYSEITGLNIQSVQRQKFLTILHHGGKLTIPQSMLPNKQAFEELSNLVAEKGKTKQRCCSRIAVEPWI